jgi:hypothetical protein
LGRKNCLISIKIKNIRSRRVKETLHQIWLLHHCLNCQIYENEEIVVATRLYNASRIAEYISIKITNLACQLEQLIPGNGKVVVNFINVL